METSTKVSNKAAKFCYNRIVIDTSVLVKAFIEEEDSSFVQDLISLAKEKQLALLATPLILFEFLNTLSKTLKDEERIQKILKKFFQSEIGLIPYRYGYLEKAIKIACETKASYYDSSYHALAKEMKGIFLTADEKYYEMMKDEGNIMLLSEAAR